MVNDNDDDTIQKNIHDSIKKVEKHLKSLIHETLNLLRKFIKNEPE